MCEWKIGNVPEALIEYVGADFWEDGQYVEFEIQHEGRNPYFFFGICEGKHDVHGVCL